MDYSVLRTEILTDPKGYGYAGKPDSQIADLLNLVRSGETVQRDIISTWEILESTVPTEWTALSTAEKQRYQTIVSAGQVNVRGTNVRAMLAAMFGQSTTTRTNLLALQTRPASRAEALFGPDIAVSHTDVAIALRG